MRGDIYWFQNWSCKCTLLCSLTVSVACRSSFHKNWHQTQYKLNLQYCMKLFRFKEKCGKMLTHGKFGLWCYHKYVKFISRFFLYSWKMASCGFVVWNWNLEVCFSSAVTLTPPILKYHPICFCIFTEFLKKKKNGGGKEKDAGILTSLPLPGGRQALRWGLLRDLCMVTGSQTASQKWLGHFPNQTPVVASSFPLSSISLLVKFRWVHFSLMEKLFGETYT